MTNIVPRNNKTIIPPIIQDWIDKINSTSTPSHIRKNYIDMLENVVNIANETLKKSKKR